LGVVIYNDKMVPVFVADTGPTFRIGEGSAALFQAAGVDRCRERNAERKCTRYLDASIEKSVLFFVFPKSAIKDLKREEALDKIKESAMKKFEDLKNSLR
jgi:Fungal chitosanase of glycosyl hydrolase group 75